MCPQMLFGKPHIDVLVVRVLGILVACSKKNLALRVFVGFKMTRPQVPC